MSATRLVADVGGTNVRFAVAGDTGNLERVQNYQVADFPAFADALAAYRSAHGIRNLNACAIAAAGPVDGDRVKLTNNAWSIDRAELAALVPGVPVALVNDLEAVAAALPHLTVGEVQAIGGPAPVRPENRTMLAVNVGTGFGAASAIRRGDQWWTCPSEAGHATIGPFDGFQQMPAEATVESVLSAKGVADIYRSLEPSDPAPDGTAIDAAAVFARADRDAVAARVVDLITSMLGRVAGDLALATAAWGGVYFCGSVAVGWSAVAAGDKFRAEFTRKGPMRARMQQVPTAVIRRDNVSLFGLARMPLSR